MKILYFGSVCDEEWFDTVSSKKSMPSQVAQYMFEKALVSGFSNIENIDMNIYYLYQEPYYPKGTYLRFKKRIKKLNNKYIVSYLSNINLPFIKEIFSFFQGLTLTMIWGLKNRNNDQKVILTPFNYTPLSLGIYLASKVFRIKRVNIFTDLSSDILSLKRQKDMPRFKKFLLPYYIKLVDFIEHNYDGYVLFTEPMNSRVNPLGKPYIVMEGIFNNDLVLSNVAKRRSIMYAGTLAFEYGVKNIIDAFEEIKDDELELWLFGDGDMKEYINELCKRDKRVHFFGFLPREQVFEYEKKATLLVNIRDPKDKYTMYSFPSKTFEYMVSGTPFLTTKLMGIPEEYYKFMYTIDSIDINTLKSKIEEILSTPQSTLNELGLEARQFVIKNKNSNTQTLKINTLMEKISSESI
ncbi:glycosyltransferase [Peribacillus aracenensis]|uniref:glycosyltransferase n=1 Tax=Peribacillus aracenensis TaxID=2976708 RepID=UPI0021A3E806|nr:glycosyltransferase [Peribacillus sp. BBB004]